MRTINSNMRELLLFFNFNHSFAHIYLILFQPAFTCPRIPVANFTRSYTVVIGPEKRTVGSTWVSVYSKDIFIATANFIPQ